MQERNRAATDPIGDVRVAPDGPARAEAADADLADTYTRLRESEELFRQIAENIREVFWVCAPDYSAVTYVSPGYLHVWGRTPESFYADPLAFLDTVHPDDRERVADALPRMGPDFDQEFRILRPDGELRWIRSRAFPVRGEDGEVVRIVGVGEDITERVRLLQAERDARAEVVSILERITDAFFALDREWRFIYMNGVTRSVLSSVLDGDPARVIGRNIWEVLAPFAGTVFEDEYRRAMATQEAAHFEAYSEPFDAWFEVHAYPSPGGLSVYFCDVTRRRRAEEERIRLLRAAEEARAEAEQRREELEAVMESRTRLVRGFSHDLKNPLGAADGYLELMEEGLMGPLAPKQMDSIGRVRRSIRSALSLINDLGELARADAGQIEIHPGPVELALVTRDMVEDFQAQARTSELSIDADLPDETAVVVTDAERLKQILGNLLSNAVKYTPGGGSIRVRAAADGRRQGDTQRWIMVEVQDTGPGIPADKQEEVFREFTRLDPTAAHGAGLGLAISRRLARALGGDITVHDAEPAGAVFTLWLPAREATA